MNVLFVSILHEQDVTRAEAREHIRLALREMVARELRLEVERVTLRCMPGNAPRLLLDGMPMQGGVSIAHDGRLSLAAYYADGPLGIDVMRVQDTPDWYEVTRDYLGPQVAATLSTIPAAGRALAFAQAWTRREACLKCLGLPLSEWTELPGMFRVQGLDVEPGYVGKAAVRATFESRSAS